MKLGGKDWQQRWFRGANAAEVGLAISSLDVLGDLLGRLEVLVVCRVLVVFAIVRRVLAADLGTRHINTAAIIGLEMFADGVYQEIPTVVFDEHASLTMQQEPTYVVEVLTAIGGVDGEREIPAALGVAVVAQTLALG